MVSKVKA